jgi:hypothetical protein
MHNRPPPRRGPFTAAELAAINAAIAAGRVQRITAGGWSLSQFGALLTMRAAIERQLADRPEWGTKF